MSRDASCRFCGTPTLSILDLGMQALTGHFPRNPDEEVPRGQLDLHRCPACHLVQLAENPPLDQMYGADYGYRSGLNSGMVTHLQQKVARLEAKVGLAPGDVVLDIGSNDATLLSAYATKGIERVGIDPVGANYRANYTDGLRLVPEFFSEKAWVAAGATERPRLITSIAMFYDLERPAEFARDIAAVLAPDGIWHFEQSYLPAMMQRVSYDTVCHEHLEYYSLATVETILSSADLQVIDVEMNDVNGGSFAVTATHRDGPRAVQAPHLGWLRNQESQLHLDRPEPYERFARQVAQHRDRLRSLITDLRSGGARVAAYGASTKGNVLLQFCKLGPDDLDFVIEVNEDKFGRFTPGSGIPIVSEAEGFARNPDYLLVLPWHFRTGVLSRELDYLRCGGRLIFPLPEIEVV